jgi:hypothetical protein
MSGADGAKGQQPSVHWFGQNRLVGASRANQPGFAVRSVLDALACQRV